MVCASLTEQQVLGLYLGKRLKCPTDPLRTINSCNGVGVLLLTHRSLSVGVLCCHNCSERGQLESGRIFWYKLVQDMDKIQPESSAPKQACNFLGRIWEGAPNATYSLIIHADHHFIQDCKRGAGSNTHRVLRRRPFQRAIEWVSVSACTRSEIGTILIHIESKKTLL